MFPGNFAPPVKWFPECVGLLPCGLSWHDAGTSPRQTCAPKKATPPPALKILQKQDGVAGSGLARTFFTSQAWSVLPCVRPLDAVHMTAGHNALADQVPVKSSHSILMRWHEWVVLIAGSTGSALRAVRPPNLHITPVVRRDLVYRASAMGSLYRSPLAIMAQAIRAQTYAPQQETIRSPRRREREALAAP